MKYNLYFVLCWLYYQCLIRTFVLHIAPLHIYLFPLLAVSSQIYPLISDMKSNKSLFDIQLTHPFHFFLYHFLRYGCRPGKLFRLAKCAFDGKFSEEELLKWERTFLRRFFSQQFKRSCSPDGARIGSVSLAPGDLQLPSDVCGEIWIKEAEELE